jgi:hypothetical protein
MSTCLFGNTTAWTLIRLLHYTGRKLNSSWSPPWWHSSESLARDASFPWPDTTGNLGFNDTRDTVSLTLTVPIVSSFSPPNLPQTPPYKRQWHSWQPFSPGGLGKLAIDNANAPAFFWPICSITLTWGTGQYSHLMPFVTILPFNCPLLVQSPSKSITHAP